MVEHNLAKVGVASSSLVFRSKERGEFKVTQSVESRFPLYLKTDTNTGAVVQMVRILACHARGREFEPRPHREAKVFFMVLDF